jgi:hypothetical protein
MSDFDALLDIEPVEHKTGIPEFEGTVPDSAIKAINVAITDGPQKLTTSKEGALKYKSVLKAALLLVAGDGKSLNTRDKFDKESGDYVGFSFSVGEKRVRRTAVQIAEDVALEEMNED